MCLAVVALGAHPRYALVVAANRDEFHARRDRGRRGYDAPFANIVAGRELVAGGTWFGVHRSGRWALVTNVREGGTYDPAARSRGELVPQALGAHSLTDTFAEIDGVAQRYNGFNLLAGDAAARGGRRIAAMASAGCRPACMACPAGAATRHGRRSCVRASTWLHGPPPATTMSRRSSPRSPTRRRRPNTCCPAPACRATASMLSAPFIVSDSYGTRCSTVFTIGHDGSARFHERSFDPNGAITGEVIESFALRP